MDVFEKALVLHSQLVGKLSVENKMELSSKEDLSLVYSRCSSSMRRNP